MIEIKIVTPDRIGDLDTLFCSHKLAEKCWCMWHIISVKLFHEGGAEQNKKLLTQLIEDEKEPVGILAYQDGVPKGWCAVGPRERYVRTLKTPTYRTKEPDPYQNVWLVPCFLVHDDAKGQGMSRVLLETAVSLAIEHGAEAIDGIPFTNDKRRSSGQIHVGFESTFAACGFQPIRRPSDSRVVMRRELISR